VATAGSPIDGGVVAILRAQSGDHLDRVIDALAEAGLPAIEVTLNTPGALDALRRATVRLGPAVALGAGTIRRPSEVEDAAAAGATFIVSPHTDAAIAEVAARAGLAYLPGAYTPTEVAVAWALRPLAVKLFPAWHGGPRYLRDLRGPLTDIPLVPTGGIPIDQAPEWFAAGATALGMGSPLIGDALATGDVTALSERAARLLAAIPGRPGRPVPSQIDKGRSGG
jgi:2-dehydro-3-deoxyphosphogluconate aldolase / (4S)-4-hydroxy-2-oxoglutarate aldolase